MATMREGSTPPQATDRRVVSPFMGLPRTVEAFAQEFALWLSENPSREEIAFRRRQFLALARDAEERRLIVVAAEKALPILVKASRFCFEWSKRHVSGRPDQRLRTSSFVDRWVTRCVSSCNPNIEYDCAQREADCWDPATRYDVPKDLSAMVQEVVDLSDWQAGNPLTLLIVNSAGDSSYDLGKYNDSRILVGFDPQTPESAPRLRVRYRAP